MSDLNTRPKEARAAHEAKTRPTAARLAWRLLQGHKPSATAEKHHRVRPLDLLRVHHERIVAKFEDVVYVLHCFKKKTPQTPQPDIELARKRFKELVKEISK